jgi:hypothetical protein
LVIVTIIWIVSSFDWFLIGFQLKYVAGDLYLNTYLSTASDIAVSTLAGIIYTYLGLKPTFVSLFAVSVVGSLIYIFVETTNIYLLAVFILGTKLGVGGTFNICFICNA